MMSLKAITAGWNEFFHSPVDPTFLCLFRILLGFLLVMNGLVLLPDFHEWFGLGMRSLVPLEDSHAFYSNFRINLFQLLSPSEETAWLILTGYIVASFLFMIGFMTRISAAVGFVLLVSLQNRNHFILENGDTVLRCLFFLMIFAPCGVRASVDAWVSRLRGQAAPASVPAVTIRLLQLQLTVLTLSSALTKLNGGGLSQASAFTWLSIAAEFTLGSLIWISDFRRWVLGAGLILVVGNEVRGGVGHTEWILMSAYLLLIERTDVEAAKTWLRRLLWNPRRAGGQMMKRSRSSGVGSRQVSFLPHRR